MKSFDKLVVASHNTGKISEINNLFKDFKINTHKNGLVDAEEHQEYKFQNYQFLDQCKTLQFDYHQVKNVEQMSFLEIHLLFLVYQLSLIHI